MTLDDLRQRIQDALDPDEFVAVLGITTQELLEELSDTFLERYSSKFYFLGDEDDN